MRSAIGSAVQQLAGGLAAIIASHLVSTGDDGQLKGFALVGYAIVGTTFVAAMLVLKVRRDMQLSSRELEPG